MLYDTKKMNSIEYQVYNKWFAEFSDCCKDLKIIYTKTSPEICLDRINKRARHGENINLNYLQNCHLYHEIWLNNEINFMDKNLILEINGNIERNNFDNFDYFNIIMDNICKFLKFN